MKRFALCVALALAAGLTAAPAHALGPVDLEAAAVAGYGTNPAPYHPYPNPLGVGFGLRAGVSVIGIYAGLRFEHYLGGEADYGACGFCGTGPFTEHLHATLYGGELGYGITLGPVTLRPQLGFGAYAESATQELYGYVEPGAAILFQSGIFLAGVDVGALVVPSYTPFTVGDVLEHETLVSYMINAQIGVRL
jgi:opacity protein-like surface antigen